MSKAMASSLMDLVQEHQDAQAKAARNPPNFWDPISYEFEEPTPQCLLRAKRDIMDIYTQPPPGVFIAPEENNITKIHALVLGPFDTPYEGGFFHFIMKCPPDYPIQPPRVRLMTTDGGRVRFNPNLYNNGKVCLSILGTWVGPAWSPAQCIASVLVSIQSLMTENPYYNEPGYESERWPGEAARYNTIIQHETIRVAVCNTVEACLQGNSPCPAPLREVILKSFPDFYNTYENVVKSHLHLSGSPMNDPFGDKRGVYQFSTLLTRLQSLNEQIKKKNEAANKKEKKEKKEK
ncbi:ubiquitin-conjugating enzyme E2 Z [Rhipicephalus sanguineus]|uniref:ubiquitin-conjugating enzyme E2 Z n=1 Tax=Rhipicephalus sanguineus TaxID=34632 RepID=UPI0020C58AF7|nr:ubiquitin-conjugating enzyme E2 Z [Rhipicephalus sanguineus]